jgi:hypothetical protein
MKYFFITLGLILVSALSIAQSRMLPCKNNITPEIYYDNSVDAEFITGDTLQKNLKIVLKREFDSKVWILINDDVIFSDTIKTNTILGVSRKTVSLDYTKYKHMPVISIIANSSRDCICFYPIVGKRIAYVNDLNGGWSLEVSNAIRNYK